MPVYINSLSDRTNLPCCECIGLKIAETVNGETISLELESLFAQAGRPAAIVKDGDYTLQKGVRLWSEKQQAVVPVIEAIGHVMARALKVQFEKTTSYQQFTSLINKGAQCLRQTELAFLIPPKLRSKGRFQSIGKLGKWGEKILHLLFRERPRKSGRLISETARGIAWFYRIKRVY